MKILEKWAFFVILGGQSPSAAGKPGQKGYNSLFDREKPG